MAELLADFMAKESESVPHIIGRGVLPIRGKMIMYGDPKSNKSFLALNIALCMAKGEPVFGAITATGSQLLPVQKAWTVLYIEQEVGEDGLRERLRAAVESPATIPLYIKTRDMGMRMDTDSGRRAIATEIEQVRPDVTILDPLAKFHLSDENSAQHMGAIMRVGDHWIEDYGTALIYVHHTSKTDPRPEYAKQGPQRIRGSSALFGDADALVEVNRMSAPHHKEPTVKLSFELRRGEPIDPIYVKRLQSGICQWMGADFKWGRPPKEQKGVYDEL